MFWRCGVERHYFSLRYHACNISLQKGKAFLLSVNLLHDHSGNNNGILMDDLQSISAAITRFGTHSLIEQSCPSCGVFPLRGFYAVRGVPIHSTVLVKTREEALRFPRGDIHLAYCWKCGFITNVSYDRAGIQALDQPEEVQRFTETDIAFQRKLANYLIDNFDLRSKKILEIGCGQGDFLALLCELGDNTGLGFDPAFVADRAPVLKRGELEFKRETFSIKHINHKADFYVCKLILQDIQPVREYVKMVRKAVGDRPEVVVFFQTLETFRILRELAFWDIHYTNCSYFSSGSLGRLFRACGFDVLDLWTDFDGQYLMIEARPGVSGPLVPPLPQENDVQDLLPLAGYFSQAIKQKVGIWRMRLQEFHRSGLKSVLWDGGSKSVAFLTTLGISNEIQYVVDDNPYRYGTFIPGTGQQIISPDFLKEYHPDVVIVMNQVFVEEIRSKLLEMNLSPDLLVVNT